MYSRVAVFFAGTSAFSCIFSGCWNCFIMVVGWLKFNHAYNQRVRLWNMLLI